MAQRPIQRVLFLAALVALPPSLRAQPTPSNDFPITIAAPKQKWYPVASTAGDVVDVECDTSGFTGNLNRVKVVSEIIAVAKGSVKATTFRIDGTLEKDAWKRPKATVTALGFMTLDTQLEGVGELRIYLIDGKKTVSNTLTFPVAGGAAAIAELTSKLGPAIVKQPQEPPVP